MKSDRQTTILTTLVRNPLTLPILFRYTDVLAARGSLTALRIVDGTGSHSARAALRSLIPTDGESGTSIVAVDAGVVKSKDPSAFLMMGAAGYQQRFTGRKLTPGSGPVTIAGRGPGGFLLAVSTEEKRPSWLELVAGPSSCFLRTGKGGGSVLASSSTPGIVAGGLAWRTAEVAWSLDGTVEFKLDTGDILAASVPAEVGQLSLFVSAPPAGSTDLVVSHLPSRELGAPAGIDRSYVSYFSKMPALGGGEAVDVVSKCDIVFIDVENWEHIASGGVIFAFGDSQSIGPMTRMGVVKRSTSSQEMHLGFFDRSLNVVKKFSDACKAKKVLKKDASSGELAIQVVGGPSAGIPIFSVVLDESVVQNGDIIKEYISLASDGLRGLPLSAPAEEVLSYLDVILSTSDQSARDFLVELVETLHPDLRSYLSDLLGR